MNFRSIALVSVFSLLLISPCLTLPLLDSHTLGHLAVPLISIGGSIVAGKIIGDYLEGKPVFGHTVLHHTTFGHHGHHGHHGKSVHLVNPLELLGLPHLDLLKPLGLHHL